jgi:hypothetical protein
VGFKMLFADIYQVPIVVALSVVGSIVLISVIASMIRSRQVGGDSASAEPRVDESRTKRLAQDENPPARAGYTQSFNHEPHQ